MAGKGERNPVLLVTGWVGSPNHFAVLENRLKIDRWQVFTLNLKHIDVEDMEKAAAEVQHKIEDIRIQTKSKVDVVCYSVAGLVVRYYLKFMGGINAVQRYVSVGTPHYGTTVMFLLADLDHLLPGSGFLEQLNTPVETTGNIHYTAVWSSVDEIVQPVENGKFKVESGLVQNREVKNLMHLALVTHVDSYKFVKEGLLK